MGVNVGVEGISVAVGGNWVAVAVIATTSKVIATNSWDLVGGVGKHEATNIVIIMKQSIRFFAFMVNPFMQLLSGTSYCLTGA